MRGRNKKIRNFEQKKIRIKTIGVRLTETEFKNIAKHCKKLGISKSRMFRYLWHEYLETVAEV